jgi:hypothetical protein
MSPLVAFIFFSLLQFLRPHAQCRKLTHSLYNLGLRFPQRSLWRQLPSLGFEVSTAVTMKNAVFWDVAPCRSCEMNQRFGVTYCLHLQDKNQWARNRREQVDSDYIPEKKLFIVAAVITSNTTKSLFILYVIFPAGNRSSASHASPTGELDRNVVTWFFIYFSKKPPRRTS